MAAPLPPGVKLLRTLRGHEDWIAKIAWSPDGRTLASPSGDKTIRLWDAETVRICLHGDLHEARRELVSHWLPNKLHVIGAGSFGATAADRPASTPRLYNLLEIRRDLRSVRVHTRCQPRPDGPWKGWNEWPHPKVGGAAVSYYDIDW